MNHQKIHIEVQTGMDKSVVTLIHPGGVTPVQLASLIIDIGLKILKQTLGFTGESPIQDGELDEK